MERRWQYPELERIFTKCSLRYLKTYLSEILIQLYFSPTPRSSGQSILHSLMLRCSPGYPTERTMMIGMQIDRNSGQRYQLCFILDTSMTHGKIFPRTATPRCLRTCCSRIRKSQLDLAWTTSSKISNQIIFLLMIQSLGSKTICLSTTCWYLQDLLMPILPARAFQNWNTGEK